MIDWDKYNALFDSIYATAAGDQKLKIAELRSDLAAASLESVDAKRKILELEIRLRDQALAPASGAGGSSSRPDELEFDGRVYWKPRPGGEKREGPFCQKCWDVNTKQVRLQRDAITRPGFGTEMRGWRCMNCNSFFPDK